MITNHSVAEYYKKLESKDVPDEIKTIKTLREGFTRLAKMYEGGDVEAFCLQMLDHTKEYEDRAIIKQLLQPDT